ncbi:hypothetical protein AAG570_008765 [Ranatra chinensis]|uniref:Fasciclin-2 n=1 Tax=Ranatra chinensis TaxID=642074 RepID=A0ABD0Z8Y5_9HEMI
MPGDKALALIINSLQKNDEGDYMCTALYAGSTRLVKTVRLKTFVAVTWEDAPEEQNPLVGQDYRVKCRVRAEPPPHVEWRINGVDVPEASRYIVETDGLLIQKVQESDDGIYTCRAFVVETGELAERNIRVEVYTLPRFIDGMSSSLEVVDGESASITCNATGKPKPTYSWIRASSQENLGIASDRFSVNEVTGVLTVNRVTQDDNGEFKCVATNGAGTIERTVRFLVIVKPKVTSVKNESVPVGKEARLECRATGNPLPAITFRKLSSQHRMIAGLQPDGRIIVDQREDRDRQESVGTLIINPLEKKDDGLYACIAKNKGGEEIKNGHLQVQFSPTFENSPMKEAWSWSRKPINLTCIAESIPNATISWRLNDRDIEKDPNFRKYGSGPQSSLLVTPSDPRFYGVYKCVAKNILGEDFHAITLREAHVPSEILQAKLDVITATTITFSFIGPSNTGGRPVKAYAVEFKKEKDNWSESQNKTWPVDSPYILENLEPQTAYNFRFAALNEVGLGNWAATQHHMMPKRSNPEEPLILNQPTPEGFVISQFGDRFELRWKKPADNGEYIDKYQIEYCNVHKVNDIWTETEAGCRTLEVKSAEQVSVDVMELSPDTYYKVELRAHNAIGFSTPGQVYIRTAKGGENLVVQNSNIHLSSSLLVAVVVSALIIVLIIIDVSCYFVNDTGLLWLMCGKKSPRKSRDDDTKLGSEGKELLNNGNKDGKIRIESKPMMDDGFKRDTTVEYDMKKSVSRTSFVGKDSAV